MYSAGNLVLPRGGFRFLFSHKTDLPEEGLDIQHCKYLLCHTFCWNAVLPNSKNWQSQYGKVANTDLAIGNTKWSQDWSTTLLILWIKTQEKKDHWNALACYETPLELIVECRGRWLAIFIQCAKLVSPKIVYFSNFIISQCRWLNIEFSWKYVSYHLIFRIAKFSFF